MGLKQKQPALLPEIVKSIFLICHPPLFHNFNLAVAFSSAEPCWSFLPGRRRNSSAQNTAGKAGRTALIRCRLVPPRVGHLNIMSWLQEGPRKGRCGPLACCILARRQHLGHPDESLPSSFSHRSG